MVKVLREGVAGAVAEDVVHIKDVLDLICTVFALAGANKD